MLPTGGKGSEFLSCTIQREKRNESVGTVSWVPNAPFEPRPYFVARASSGNETDRETTINNTCRPAYDNVVRWK